MTKYEKNKKREKYKNEVIRFLYFFFFLLFQLINTNAIREKVEEGEESQRVGEKKKQNNKKPFE